MNKSNDCALVNIDEDLKRAYRNRLVESDNLVVASVGDLFDVFMIQLNRVESYKQHCATPTEFVIQASLL